MIYKINKSKQTGVVVKCAPASGIKPTGRDDPATSHHSLKEISLLSLTLG